MPQLRRDPVVGRWVIISTERARRPGNFVDPQKNYPTDDFKAPQLKSLLTQDQEFKETTNGLYDVRTGYGFHEIITETTSSTSNMADLSLDEIQVAIKEYVVHLKRLESDEHLHYAFVYKKFRGDSQSLHSPAHSQIIATTVIPAHIKDQLVGAKNYFAKNNRCIYSDMIDQEEKSKERIITSNDQYVALSPFAPRFPFEIWIVPRKHDCDFLHGVKGSEEKLAEILKDILSRYKLGLDDPGYSMVINSAPFRRDKSRWTTIEEDYCWNIQLKPKLTYIAGFEKGTGFYICSIPPELSTKFLKDVEVKL